MKNPGALKVSTPSDREIKMVRVFDAPHELVFEALTEPEMIEQWLIGPPGWKMVGCDVDPIVTGAYRYLWRDKNGTEMGMGGFFREIVPFEKIVATEAFDDPWYPGHAVDTTVLTEKHGKTTLTLTVQYESQEARDIALKSDMTKGLSANYDKLDTLLASRLAHKEA